MAIKISYITLVKLRFLSLSTKNYDIKESFIRFVTGRYLFTSKQFIVN